MLGCNPFKFPKGIAEFPKQDSRPIPVLHCRPSLIKIIITVIIIVKNNNNNNKSSNKLMGSVRLPRTSAA